MKKRREEALAKTVARHLSHRRGQKHALRIKLSTLTPKRRWKTTEIRVELKLKSKNKKIKLKIVHLVRTKW